MKLDKTKVYSLEDLTSEERKELANESKCDLVNGDWRYLLFERNMWVVGDKERSSVNAKELFYTLENIQVDCRGLTSDQIKEMADIFEKAGYKVWDDDNALTVDEFNYLLDFAYGDVFVSKGSKEKTTITYEKFIELFTATTQEVTEKPKHYSKGIDTFARMEANCTKEECLAFAKGNIDKYNWREKGQDLEDYKKIVSYANWAIKLLKDETKS